MEAARIVLVEVDGLIEEALARLASGDQVVIEPIRSEEVPSLGSEKGPIDVAVIGTRVKDPIRTGQTLYSRARDVALVFLCEADQVSSLKRAALLSPFLGGDIACVRGEVEAAQDAVRHALRRARRGRQHRAMAAFAVQSLGYAPPKKDPRPLLETLLEHVQVGVVALDDQLRVRALNLAATRILRVAEREAFGRTLGDLAPPSERPKIDALVRSSIASSGPVPAEVVELAPDAGFLEVSVFPLAAPAGGGALALVQDVTERELAKTALQAAAADLERRTAELARSVGLLRATLEATTDGILIVDGDRRIADYNRRFLELWRIPDEVIAARDDRTLMEFVVDQLTDPERFLARVHELYRDPNAESSDALELTEGRLFERLSRPLWLNGRSAGRVWIFRDQTERKQLQSRLLVTDRLASLGTLAAGVAHEINNPLAYITSNLAMVAEDIRALGADVDSSKVAALTEMTGDALEGAERVRKIVSGLKAFSRAEDERRVMLDVHEVLDSAVRMTFNELRHHARLNRRYGVLPLVPADEARLAQVFINLLINAAQAIPAGRVDENEICVSTWTDAQGRATVRFTDSGGGIPAELLSRIFDPFFTTKPVGVGTGLGLSICHTTVTSLGGELSVESTVGSGTSFTVSLPPGEADEQPARTPSPAVGAAGRTGRVLVIDDDRLVCAVLQRVLKGHQVVLAHSGRDALSMLERGEHFDLLLCDLMMPNMTGMDLHAEIARSFPALLSRIVFMTGGVFTPAARIFLEQIPNERLEKPFEMEGLRALVRRLLS